MSGAARWSNRRTAFRCAAVLIALWVVSALVLSSDLPKKELETRLSQALRAPVRIGKVEFHPFTLQLKLFDGRALNPGGEGTLLTFDELTLTPSLHLSGGAPSVHVALRVLRPVLDITHLGGGVFSFSDPAAEAAGVSDPPEEGGLSLIVPSRLDVRDGTVFLRDAPLDLTHTIRRIEVSAPLAVVPGRSGDRPAFSAEINGTRFEVEGRAVPRGRLLRTEFFLRSAPLEMRHFERYLALYTPLRLTRGTVRLDTTFGLSRAADGSVAVDVAGEAAVSDVEVQAPDGAVMGRLDKGAFRLRRFTLAERRISLSRVELSGLYLRAARDKNGRIDWEKWLEPAFSPVSSPAGSSVPDSSEAAPALPLIVEGTDLLLQDSSFTWSEASRSGTEQVEITGVDGRIAEYSTRPGARTMMRLSFGINNEGMLALEGEGYFDPAGLDARVTIQDLPLTPPASFPGGAVLADSGGRIDLKGRLRLSGKQSIVEVDEGALRSVAFGRKESGRRAVQARRVSVAGALFDAQNKKIRLTRLGLEELVLRAGADFSSWNLALPDQSVAQSVPGGWTLDVDATTISARVERLAAGRAEPVAEVQAEIASLSTDPRRTSRFTLRARGADGGGLHAAGTFLPEPLRLEMSLQADALPLEKAAALLRPYTNLTLTGKAEADLTLAVQRTETAKSLQTSVSGRASLRDVVLCEAGTNRRFGSFRRLTADRFRYTSAPASCSVAGVLLDRPRLFLTLGKDGRLNLPRMLRPNKADVPEKRQASPFVLSSFSLGGVRVQNGSLRFRDERLTPALSVSLANLDASLGEVAPGSGPASFSLAAHVDGAPLHIKGAIAPAESPAADLDITVTDVDLRRYSAYVLSALGYPVEQGSLNLRTKFVSDGMEFRTENALLLQRLILGPQDTRPGAPDYPLALGLSLLRDLKGNISLDVPVWGRLDADHLQVGSLIGQAMGGLLTKIITSPFALLGGIADLASSPSALRMPAFSPGRATLSRQAKEQAAAVADRLQRHPKLRAEVLGWYEPENDAAGLAEQRVRQKIREKAYAELSETQRAGTNTDAVRLSSDAYERLLLDVYRETLNGRGLPAPRAEADVMERKLRELERIDSADLKYLAARRAEAVRRAVAESNPAVADRIVLLLDVYGRPQTKIGAARAEVRLR